MDASERKGRGQVWPARQEKEVMSGRKVGFDGLGRKRSCQTKEENVRTQGESSEEKEGKRQTEKANVKKKRKTSRRKRETSKEKEWKRQKEEKGMEGKKARAYLTLPQGRGAATAGCRSG